MAGMIAFKATGGDYHYAGIVMDHGMVVYSSNTQNGRGVAESPQTINKGAVFHGSYAILRRRLFTRSAAVFICKSIINYCKQIYKCRENNPDITKKEKESSNSSIPSLVR